MRHVITLVASAILAAVPAAAQTPSPPVQQVQVYSYGYNPGTIHLAAGRPVTLQFVNSSGSGHDFTAKAFFSAARIMSGAVDDGEVDLKGHSSAAVTLVPARGRYPVHCGHFLHKQFGMSGWIVVD